MRLPALRPARLLLAHASVLLALVRQAFMAVYKTLTDGIIADEVADQQARTLHTPGSASAATPCPAPFTLCCQALAERHARSGAWHSLRCWLCRRRMRSPGCAR